MCVIGGRDSKFNDLGSMEVLNLAKANAEFELVKSPVFSRMYSMVVAID